MSVPEQAKHSDTDEAADPRPPVWVGHITLPTHQLPETHEFMLRLGMRPIASGDDFAVLELRGGTHLVLLHTEDASPKQAGFDLMVDDIDATRTRFREQGIAMSDLQENAIHRSFTVTTPAGHEICFNSSHVSDRPV